MHTMSVVGRTVGAMLLIIVTDVAQMNEDRYHRLGSSPNLLYKPMR